MRVVVATFEAGENVGDTHPGELRQWIERYPLPRTIPFPVGYQDLRYNRADPVLGVVTGTGQAHAAASIMAPGPDPRFDLSKAYGVLASIAGVDPNKVSLGSLAWANYDIDGDLDYEIDPRETPADWPTGRVPYDRSKPYQETPSPLITLTLTLIANRICQLNAGLVKWAYAPTADVEIPDSGKPKSLRAAYPNDPNAQKPPFVRIGDAVTNDPFWIGAKFTECGQNGSADWTHGDGKFDTAACEDCGYGQGFAFLVRMHRIDLDRVTDLRTASDYTTQPAGMSAGAFLASDCGGNRVAADTAFESAFLVGSKFVREIATHWNQHADQIPTSP